MNQHKQIFQSTFSHLYFLMLSADRIADLEELKVGNKIIQLENFDKTEVMNNLDYLSTQSRENVYQQGINLLKSLSREEQLKVMGYVKMIAKADGSYDETESDLLNEISMNELNISLQEIAEKEKELLKAVS